MNLQNATTHLFVEPVIGVDLGGTNIRAAVVQNGSLSNVHSAAVNSSGTVEEVLQQMYDAIDPLFTAGTKAIGIGVPSVVDTATGVVYDVQYIPAWKEVPLKSILEQRYSMPVFINNDANCFALGEYYFGAGKGFDSLVGLTIGTGLGAGIIINQKLYAGPNCGAGEFGMVDYLDGIYENYASGQFFKRVYGREGLEVYQNAQKGNEEALQMYAAFGRHLGAAVKMIMYTVDPQLIILGGSVSAAFPFFEKTLWEQVHTFAYARSAQNLKIEKATLLNNGLLGAAALYYNNAASKGI